MALTSIGSTDVESVSTRLPTALAAVVAEDAEATAAEAAVVTVVEVAAMVVAKEVRIECAIC